METKETTKEILQDLKLVKCQHTKIGGDLIKGVSGGERKRTSIGVELISNPSLIFLDEPTTGLDSYTATSLMKILKIVMHQIHVYIEHLYIQSIH